MIVGKNQDIKPNMTIPEFSIIIECESEFLPLVIIDQTPLLRSEISEEK